MLLEFFLFALYFGFFSWLTYKPNRNGLSRSKLLFPPGGEAIEIVTATPKEQVHNQPLVAVEVNLSNAIKKEYISSRLTSRQEVEERSELRSVEGELAIALHNQSIQNLQVEEFPTTSTAELKYDNKIINQAVEQSRLAVGQKIKEFIEKRQQRVVFNLSNTKLLNWIWDVVYLNE